MPPYKEPLFYLKPASYHAKKIVEHAAKNDSKNDPKNQLGLVKANESFMLGIGHYTSQSSSPNVLAVLGRGDSVDVYLDRRSISRIQASFEIHPQSKAILFIDHSPSHSSQVFGEGTTPFEQGRTPRQVVINNGVNTVIGMGGSKQNHIAFELIWHLDKEGATKWTDNIITALENYDCHPRPEITSQEIEARQSSWMERVTRTHTQQTLRIRYVVLGEPLDSGSHGTVLKGMNLDTGDLMAVKVIKRAQNGLRIKTEVETHSRLKHSCIVDFLGTEKTDLHAAIFLPLMHGNLLTLINNPEVENEGFLVPLFHQMLQALDYLASQKVIHGDIKPTNILYLQWPNSEYQFKLGDFGLSFQARKHKSRPGTLPYMAPEVFYGDEEISHKIDVWSLYVTMLCTASTEAQSTLDFSLNAEGDQVARYDRVLSNYKTVLRLTPMALEPYLGFTQEMARISPDDRASAAQMLVKCCDGVGLTTRGVIQAIPQPRNDDKLLQKKHKYFSDRQEKNRLMREWSIASSDLLTSCDTDEEECEADDGYDTDRTEDTIRLMEAALEEELQNEAMDTED